MSFSPVAHLSILHHLLLLFFFCFHLCLFCFYYCLNRELWLFSSPQNCISSLVVSSAPIWVMGRELSRSAGPGSACLSAVRERRVGIDVWSVASIVWLMTLMSSEDGSEFTLQVWSLVQRVSLKPSGSDSLLPPSASLASNKNETWSLATFGKTCPSHGICCVWRSGIRHHRRLRQSSQAWKRIIRLVGQSRSHILWITFQGEYYISDWPLMNMSTNDWTSLMVSVSLVTVCLNTFRFSL